MRIQTGLFMSHAAAGAVAAASFALSPALSNPTHSVAFAGGATLAGIVAASWYVSRRVLAGLSDLESVVHDHEKAGSHQWGCEEFRETGRRIAGTVASWEHVAARTRDQARDFQSVMLLLERRDSNEKPSCAQLRKLLAALGSRLRSHLDRTDEAASLIQRDFHAIAESNDAQGRAIVKTSAYMEQMSSTIESVASHAVAAETAFDKVTQSAFTSLEEIGGLIEGMDRMREGSQACEKKLRGLSDPAQQISATVATIGDIAARTDLLALNASIESIRAGEHGRGFAVVAEEVRKLAEQSANATREISSLVESMNLVTQESVRAVEREREQLELEVARAMSAESFLQQVCAVREGQLGKIAEVTTQQRQLTQDVSEAIEEINASRKASRHAAENVGWTGKSLAESNSVLDEIVGRLMECGDKSVGESLGETSGESHAPPIHLPPIESGAIACEVTL